MRRGASIVAAIQPALEHWNDSILVHKGQEVRIDGMGYSGIGRLHTAADHAAAGPLRRCRT